MKNQISDEKIDRILERIVKDSALDAETADRIAASPELWRSVQRKIAEENARPKRSWIPTWEWRIAIFASLAFVFYAGLIWFSGLPNTNPVVTRNLHEDSLKKTSETAKAEINDAPENGNSDSNAASPGAPKVVPAKKVSPKNDLRSRAAAAAKPQKMKSPVKQAPPQAAPQYEGIKTDFIALGYAPTPESGQILKVKVPRAMMVSLGVSNKVENGSELVSAEVLVGADGAARAIRFVQ